MMRWLRLAMIAIAGFAVISFAVDLAVFKLSGSPRSKYTVKHFVSAPLKDQKQEIDYTGSEDVPCALSIYPQDGFVPCWYLRRHTNQVRTY
jgi:hypothetical protein